MISQSQIELVQSFSELSVLSQRDSTQGTRLAKYKKNATSMLKNDPICANTLLGLVACLEHDLESMHACHKKAIGLSESCLSLIYYAASLEKACLWNESARYALLALDYDPGNLKVLDSIIKLAPLTGRFSLFKRLLPQWQQANNGVPHPYQGHYEIISDLLAQHGLLEKDLKPLVTAIGDALSETKIILQKFQYDIVTRKHDAPFIHFRFVIPDEFVSSYYEDLLDDKLATLACHPRLFDAFSLSVENATLYQLYQCMDKELEESADTIRVPDPDKMKLIEELIEGVEF
jgi:hypothetical protein